MSESYEEFSENQSKLLEQFVSNVDSNVFVLRNLPEVIKGALFSRYSRSTLGLRSLLLKEFISNDETGFNEIVAIGGEKQASIQEEAIKKAQNFYDRILDGYGDDSIGELGGAHLALENLSMLACKVIEDSRIGGSPLEKSTRYIYFDQKVKGEYLFYREPVLMTSAYRDIYIDTCNELFETYSRLIVPTTGLIEKSFPKDPDISKVAYRAALRAKVLDCLRGLLPASTLTNMGVYGNGRFFEGIINRLNSHNLAEMQELGKKTYNELAKTIPSFIRRAGQDHRNYQAYSRFKETMEDQIKHFTDKLSSNLKVNIDEQSAVKLVSYDPTGENKVLAALLFPHSNHSLEDISRVCQDLTDEEKAQILDAACESRENRRHKSPRALEHASFTFEITADFGCYRDMQRHRMLTQERQLLSCDYGYTVPQELIGTEMEGEYLKALEKAQGVFELIRQELPEEAQYVVPMAYNIRWYFHVNLRALQWMCELRSSPAGHPNYRYLAQEMAKQVGEVFPAFERFFKFVDFEGYQLGRLGQEQRLATKKEISESLK